MRNREELVLIYDPGVMGVTRGGLQAYTTMVRWFDGGMEFELFLDNDEFEVLGDEPLDD